MNVVVDASVTLKWLFTSRPQEQNIEEALTLLKAIGDGACEVFQPFHWRAEVMSVVARLKPGEIDAALGLLHRVPCVVVEDVQTLRRAAFQSAHIGHHLFDTLYHAVAIENQATLITSDEDYFRKAQGLGSIQLLSELSFDLASI